MQHGRRNNEFGNLQQICSFSLLGTEDFTCMEEGGISMAIVHCVQHYMLGACSASV